jgi:hypothetical protein
LKEIHTGSLGWLLLLLLAEVTWLRALGRLSEGSRGVAVTMLEGDTEVQARAAQVEAMLRDVCDPEEFPWFVSDQATLFDVCSLTPDELIGRLVVHYGRRVHPSELHLPIWKLVDRLQAML